MTEAPSIQWFPGHMAKTRRLMRESLRLVDIVVEVIDARIPISSRNPDLPGLVGSKPRIVLLNKADAADDNIPRAWCEFYKEKGITAIPTDCRSGKGIKQFVPAVKEVLRPLLERRAQKGMEGAPIRMMIVGIPNVGKSSFINKVVKQNRAKVEDRPGVTRGNQWFTLDRGFELLDTPGVLWPKFDDRAVGDKLAFIGSVKDDILDVESLAVRFLEVMKNDYPDRLTERYKITDFEDKEPYEILEMIGRKRGMLISGGEINTERAATTILDEYRAGKLGKITLDSIPAE